MTGCRAVPFTPFVYRQTRTHCYYMYVSEICFELSFHFPTFSLLDCSQPAGEQGSIGEPRHCW